MNDNHHGMFGDAHSPLGARTFPGTLHYPTMLAGAGNYSNWNGMYCGRQGVFQTQTASSSIPRSTPSDAQCINDNHHGMFGVAHSPLGARTFPGTLHYPTMSAGAGNCSNWNGMCCGPQGVFPPPSPFVGPHIHISTCKLCGGNQTTPARHMIDAQQCDHNTFYSTWPVPHNHGNKASNHAHTCNCKNGDQMQNTMHGNGEEQHAHTEKKNDIASQNDSMYKEFIGSPYCSYHTKTPWSDKGCKEMVMAPVRNINIPIKSLTKKVHTLLKLHSGCLPLPSLPYCYEDAFKDSIFNMYNIGVPLEHAISCIKSVDLKQDVGGVKHVVWFIARNNDVNDRKKSSQTIQLDKLDKQVIELLEKSLHCQLAFNLFLPSYNQYFKKQLCVADYGFTKLSQLLEAFTDSVQVLGEGDERIITISHRAQVRRFTSDLLVILNAQASKQLALSSLPDEYARVMRKTWDVVNYGVCCLEDMIDELSPTKFVITRLEDTIISVHEEEEIRELEVIFENLKVVNAEHNSTCKFTNSSKSTPNVQTSEDDWWKTEVPAHKVCTVERCTYSPLRHARHGTYYRRAPYGDVENRIMIKFIIDNDLIESCTRMETFTTMRDKKFMTHRPLDSLETHFRKIVLDLIMNNKYGATVRRMFEDAINAYKYRSGSISP